MGVLVQENGECPGKIGREQGVRKVDVCLVVGTILPELAKQRIAPDRVIAGDPRLEHPGKMR